MVLLRRTHRSAAAVFLNPPIHEARLLLLPTTGYRNKDFLAAAQKLDVEIVPAANYCHQLAPT